MKKRKWRPKFLPKNWHPASLSEQARWRANGLFRVVMSMMHNNKELRFYDDMGEYHENVTPGQYVAHVLNNTHQPKVVRYRAAKRFGQMWRKHLAK